MKSSIFLLIGAVLLPTLATAGDGHDHGHDHDAAPIAASPNAPQRQPDGSVFLPKQTQRFIQVRTQPAKLETLPRSLILNGQVVAGINAHAKVQALQAGRLNVIGGALPPIGDRVTQGQRLATITLAASDIQEVTNQAAERAELQTQLELAQLEQQRLHKLGDHSPRRDADAAVAIVRGLRARIAALTQGITAQEVVAAPISGIVTASYAANGQAVQAGDLLLDIFDPSKLQVEALTYDAALPANIAAANVTIGKQTLALRYQGNSQQLRQQALPLRFSVEGEALTQLAVGTPLQVTVQTRATLQGVAVPAVALARNPSNQTVVWVKTAPEQYAPRVVQYQPLDGGRVIITAGLQDGERVVVQATHLINQIR